MALVLPDWVGEYAAVTASALFGGIANGSRWRDQSGAWQWSRVGIETATAVALSVGIMALGETTHLDLKILSGLGVLAGWLGPRAVSGLALKRLGLGQ